MLGKIKSLTTFLYRNLTWLDERPASWFGILCGLLAFLVPWLLYIKTGSREPAYNGDYFKMAYIGLVWGIPHSPGFPLYLIINGIVSHIPVGVQTFKIMMISATSVALAMHFVYRIGRLLKFPTVLALGAALIAATGRPIWLQAVITDVYGLHILLVVLPVWALMVWSETDDDRWMWCAVWLFILSLGNHPTAVFTLPGLMIFTLVHKPRVYLRARTWDHTGYAIIALAVLYGYIYWRSFAPPLYYEQPINGDFNRFWGFITGRDYKALWCIHGELLPKLWEIFVNLGIIAFGKLVWFAIWPGVVVATVRNPKYAIPLILVPAGLLTVSFLFSDAEPESWLSPIYAFLPLLAVSVAVWLVELTRRYLKSGNAEISILIRKFIWVIIAVTALIIFFVTMTNISTNLNELDLSGPSDAYALASRTLSAVTPPALIMTHGYDMGQHILFCLYTDDTLAVKSNPLVHGSIPDVPIAVTTNWNEETAREVLSTGSHVYIYEGISEQVGEGFILQPIGTGLAHIELYEVSLSLGFEPLVETE